MSIANTTVNRRERRVEGIVPERRLLGAVLLVIGLIVSAGFFFPDLGRLMLPGVSITFLAGFALSREYGYAIPAGITGGLGAAIVLITSATFAPAYTTAVLFLSMAAGFVTVWVLGLLASPTERHPWPLVPATILGSVGLAFAAGQPAAISWIQVTVAAVIMLAGAGLLLRRDAHRA